VKFLVDMPLPPALAQWLTTQGHDAVHASAVGLDRSADSEIPIRARQESRTVVTADLDYLGLLALSSSPIWPPLKLPGAKVHCMSGVSDSSSSLTEEATIDGL
jgi:hypothetical protein